MTDYNYNLRVYGLIVFFAIFFLIFLRMIIGDYYSATAKRRRLKIKRYRLFLKKIAIEKRIYNKFIKEAKQ